MEPSPPVEPVGEVIWIGGSVDKTSASLRFTGDILDLDSVSRLLSCVPTRVHRKGETLRGGRTRHLPSVWLLNSPTATRQTLEEQIAWLLDRVTSDLGVWEKLTAMSTGDVFCGLHLTAWNQGFSLSPGLMQRLAERHLTLEFDIYCDAEE